MGYHRLNGTYWSDGSPKSPVTSTIQGGLFSMVKALADPRGRHWCAPPMGSNSFIFAHVFTKKHPLQRLVPPQWLGPLPTGNPGSATEKVQADQQFGPTDRGTRTTRFSFKSFVGLSVVFQP